MKWEEDTDLRTIFKEVYCTIRFHIMIQVPTSSLSTRFSNCREKIVNNLYKSI